MKMPFKGYSEQCHAVSTTMHFKKKKLKIDSFFKIYKQIKEYSNSFP